MTDHSVGIYHCQKHLAYIEQEKIVFLIFLNLESGLEKQTKRSNNAGKLKMLPKDRRSIESDMGQWVMR